MGWAYFEMIQENQSFDWKKIILKHDNNIDNVYHDFTFDCPDGWVFEEKTTDSKIIVKSCSINYDQIDDLSFDDGITISFKYIPNYIINIDSDYADIKSKDIIIKYKDIVEDYFKDEFIGKIGWNKTNYELYLIARYYTSEGCYEVEASSYTETQEENVQKRRKLLIDQIISSFTLIN